MNLVKEDNSLKEKFILFLRKKNLHYKNHIEIKNAYFERWLKNINYYNEAKLTLMTETKKTLVTKNDFNKNKQETKKEKLLSLISKLSNINFLNKQIFRYFFYKWKNEKNEIVLTENSKIEINKIKDNEKENCVGNIKCNKSIKIGNYDEKEFYQNSILLNYEMKNGESITKNEIYLNTNFKQINTETQCENNKTNEDEDKKKREEKVFQLIKNRIHAYKSVKSIFKKYWDKWNEKEEKITKLKIKYKKQYKKILQIGKRDSNLKNKYILKEIKKNPNDIIKKKRIALFFLKNYFENIDSKKGLLKKMFYKWFGKPKYNKLKLKKKRTLKRFLIIRQVEEENDYENEMVILRNNILRYYIEKNEDINNIELVKNVLLAWKNNAKSIKEKISNCFTKYLLILIKKNNDLVEKYYIKWIETINKLIKNEISKKQILILNSIISNIDNKIKDDFKKYFLKWKIIFQSLLHIDKLKENRKNILIIILRKKESKIKEIIKCYLKKWNKIIIKLFEDEKKEKINSQRKNYLIHFISKLEERNNVKIKLYLLQWNNIIELIKQKLKHDRMNSLSKLLKIKLNKIQIILNNFLSQWKENLIEIKEAELNNQINIYLQILISNKENKLKHFLFQKILILKSIIDKQKENEFIQEQKNIYLKKIILLKENKTKNLINKNIQLWNLKTNELKENDLKLKELNNKKNKILKSILSKQIIQINEKEKDYFKKIKTIIFKTKLQDFIELKNKKIHAFINLKNIIYKKKQISLKKYFDIWKNFINIIKNQEIKNQKETCLDIIKYKTYKILKKYLKKWEFITKQINEKLQKKIIIVKTKKSISYKTINSNLKSYFDIWRKQINSIPFKIINFKNFNLKTTNKEINNIKSKSISPNKFQKEGNDLNKTLINKDIIPKKIEINNSKKQNYIPKPKATKYFIKKNIHNSSSKNINRVNSVQIKEREKNDNSINFSSFINKCPNKKYRNNSSYLNEIEIKNNSVIETYNNKNIGNKKNKNLKYRNVEYFKLNNEPEEKGIEDKIYLNKTQVISSKYKDLFETKTNSIHKSTIKKELIGKCRNDIINSKLVYHNINNKNLKKEKNKKEKANGDLYDKILELSNDNSKLIYENLKLLNDNETIFKGYLNNIYYQNKYLATYRIIMIYNILHSKKISNIELCFTKWKNICNIKINNIFCNLMKRNKYCIHCGFLNLFNCSKCCFEDKSYDCKWKNIYRLLRNIIYFHNDLKKINPKKYYFQIWKFSNI